MKLYVNVLEARKLKHEKLGANPIDAYVKLRMRKHRSKTGVIRGKTNLVWNEEFVLRIDDLKEELRVILVVRSCGARESEALGQAVVPVWVVAEAENQMLPPTWFPLQPLSTSTQTHVCGEILIAISLYSRSNTDSTLSSSPVPSDADSREVVCFESPGRSPYEKTDSVSEEASSGAEEKKPIKRFTGRLVRSLLHKNKEVMSNSVGAAILQSDESSDNGSVSGDPLANFNFEKALQTMRETNQENGMPDNLQGGILLDKQYLISCENLNALLFAPNSQLMKELTELQGTTNLDEEVVEFDMPEEPPSLLDMEVFDFAGPCEQALSLGHAEINLLKRTPSDLADLWIPLQGKLARISQSKLHLRIFLETTKAAQSTRKYLRKVENELGRKGRVFVSARVIGLYANIFGHKSKFIFIWEEIYDIQVTPPSLASVGSPSLVFILHEGRGLDAMRYSKSQDEEGRLKFHFQPFGSFSDASRSMMSMQKKSLIADALEWVVDEAVSLLDIPFGDHLKPHLECHIEGENTIMDHVGVTFFFELQ
ncbi:C2 and GRAM domain-containing protein [Nymphaea thermarum]|nr:C2 and GRAM domain-containing protein [Nymphaea thermarum]